MARQICRLSSVVCDVRAPYSGGLTIRDIFALHCSLSIRQLTLLTRQNHEDRPRGSPPTGAINARGQGGRKQLEFPTSISLFVNG